MITDRVRLMARAALLEDDRAVAAWEEWKSLRRRELAAEERQLAPTLVQALKRRGVADTALSTLEPYAERAWLSYQSNRVIAADVLGQLHAAGFPTLLLKGTALIPKYYGDPSARRSGDVDIAVPEPALFAAWDLLAGAGWRPVGTNQRHFDPRFIHAAQMVDGKKHSLDLHCHVLSMSCDSGADTRFWDASVHLAFDGATTRTLCGTDHLLHVCVHGQIWAFVLPVRWLSDAVTIMRSEGPAIDWARLVALARERRVTLFAAAALEQLVAMLDAPVPPDVLAALRTTQTNAVDRLLFTAWTRDSHGRPIRRAQWIAARFLRGTSGLGVFGRLRRVPRFLHVWLGEDSWLRLVRRFAFKARRQLGIRWGIGDPQGPSRELFSALTVVDQQPVPEKTP